jgi:hypothetical protein
MAARRIQQDQAGPAPRSPRRRQPQDGPQPSGYGLGCRSAKSGPRRSPKTTGASAAPSCRFHNALAAGFDIEMPGSET